MTAVARVLCALDELVDGAVRKFEIGDRSVAVIRVGDDVYVLGDQCTHQEVSLSDGVVDPDDMTIECPKHGAAFDLATGDALTLPATRPVATYSVSVEDGNVLMVVE